MSAVASYTAYHKGSDIDEVVARDVRNSRCSVCTINVDHIRLEYLDECMCCELYIHKVQCLLMVKDATC